MTLDIKIDLEPAAEENKEPEEKEEEYAAAKALALKPNWIPVTGTKYDRVQWDRTTHHWKKRWGQTDNQSGYLFCNDILIGDLQEPPTELIIDEDNSAIGDVWRSVPPTISITDNDGLLPLDLARKGFARADPELADRVLCSMWSELLASFFYSPKSSPSDMCDLWSNGDFLFSSRQWLPIIFGKSGFTLLDERQLHLLAPRNLIVLPYHKGVLERLLQDPFVDENTFVIVKLSFGSQSRSEIVSVVSDAYYRSSLPDFHHRYSRGNTTFAKKDFVFDRKIFEGALQLKKAPKYLKLMLDTGYNFKVGNRSGIVVSRHDSEDDAVKSWTGELARRVYAQFAEQFSENVTCPMVVCSEYSNANVKTSHLSEVWEQSFDANLIPYDLSARHRVLKSKAPITLFKHMS